MSVNCRLTNCTLLSCASFSTSFFVMPIAASSPAVGFVSDSITEPLISSSVWLIAITSKVSGIGSWLFVIGYSLFVIWKEQHAFAPCGAAAKKSIHHVGAHGVRPDS